jgi:hypothetical protein
MEFAVGEETVEEVDWQGGEGAEEESEGEGGEERKGEEAFWP